MKRKWTAVLLCIIVIFVLLFLWLRGRNVRLFDDMTSDDIEKFIIYHPGDTENIFSDPEDKEEFISLLQKMRLNKTFSHGRDGGLMLDICYENGEIARITLFSDSVVTDTGTYTCDRDYCDDFYKLCENLQNP